MPGRGLWRSGSRPAMALGSGSVWDRPRAQGLLSPTLALATPWVRLRPVTDWAAQPLLEHSAQGKEEHGSCCSPSTRRRCCWEQGRWATFRGRALTCSDRRGHAALHVALPRVGSACSRVSVRPVSVVSVGSWRLSIAALALVPTHPGKARRPCPSHLGTQGALSAAPAPPTGPHCWRTWALRSNPCSVHTSSCSRHAVSWG